MHRVRKNFMRRGLALLLVAIMVVGLMPGTVFGGLSEGSTGGTHGFGSSNAPFVTDPSMGGFSRFTLIRINAPDCSGTKVIKPAEVDEGLNPGCDKTYFYADESGLAINRENYVVLGSVDIGATEHGVKMPDRTRWFDTNAMEYRIICEENQTPESRIAAIKNYVKRQEQDAGTYQNHYYTWDEWNRAYVVNNAPPFYLPNFAWDGGSLTSLMTEFGSMDHGGDNASYYSSSGFFYSLLRYFKEPNPVGNEMGSGGDSLIDLTYANAILEEQKSIVFKFDNVSYRVIVEAGCVGCGKDTENFVAMTARDLAALSFVEEEDGLRRGLSYAFLRDTMAGLRDTYAQPYGYYVKHDPSATSSYKGYQMVTVATPEEKGVWCPGHDVKDNPDLVGRPHPPAHCEMFGLSSVNGQVGSCTNEYPAVGMAIVTPMMIDVVQKGLTISKQVTNTGDPRYADMEWEFKISLDVSGGGGPGSGAVPFSVTDGTGGVGEYTVKIGSEPEQTFDSLTALKAFLNTPIKLKSGQSVMIEGLPEGMTYSVEELTEGNPVDPESEGWKTWVKDTGAADTSEVELTGQPHKITYGQMPDSGIASVQFKNTEAGGPAHLIIDYNLPNATATYDDKLGTILSENIVKCDDHRVGDDVTISGAFNGQTLIPNETQITIGTVNSPSGGSVPVVAKFLGLFTAPRDGDGIALTHEGGGQFKWNLGHKDLTVIYAHWSIGNSVEDDIPPGEGSLYTVFWDYNYDGGGVTSSLAGTYKYNGEIHVNCDRGHPGSGTYHFELPFTFSYPDPPTREGWTFMGWNQDARATSGTPRPSDPGQSDTFYAIWASNITYWEGNGGTFTDDETSMYYPSAVYPRGEFIPVLEQEPTRVGYTFNGWYLDPECTQPLEGYEEGVQPGRTYYAGWTAEKVKVTYYDVREGTSVVHTQEYNYNDLFGLFGPMNDTAGWNFDHWALTTPDGADAAAQDGKNLTQDFPLVYHKYYGEGSEPETSPLPPPEDGRDPGLMSDAGYWTLDIYAVWSENTTDYDLKVVWNDVQNNDGCRPTRLRVGLVDSYMNNEVVAEETVDVSETDNEDVFDGLFADLPVEDSDASLQKRHYKIVFLGYTDCKGETYTMKSPAVDGDKGTIDLQTISTGSDATLTQYAYGVNNYSPGDGYGGANTGYDEGNYHTIITFDHALIDTGDDIKFTIDWDDDGDNDGKRPGSVMLVLYADGVPVYERPWENHKFGKDSVSAGLCEVTDDGNTWTYIFPEYQRYHDGKAIQYTVAIKNRDDLNSTFDKDEYKVEYLNPVSEEAGSPDGCIIHRTVHMEDVPVKIVWDDENNRDGQRPEYVTVALMANQWNDHTFRWEHEEIATRVVRAGEDPRNTMTASEWFADFGSQKVYNDGLRRVYHMVVLSDLNQFIPEGSHEYGWTEDLYGNQRATDEDYVNVQLRDPVAQVRIGQNTNTVSVTGNIYWDDSQNNDNIRPKNVVMQLYSHAPGQAPKPVAGEAYRVTLTGDPTADNWYYTFSGMPKYAEGQSGVELVYTIKIEEIDGEPLYGYYIITANGEEEEVLRYEASYLYENPDGMAASGDTLNTLDFNKSDRAYVRLRHVCETKTMNFSVNWHDGDNRDNVRPADVMAELYKTIGNGEPIYIETIDIVPGKAERWTYTITGLAGYDFFRLESMISIINRRIIKLMTM